MRASRGGEASLLIASTFPRIVRGAIGLVPNSSVFPSPVASRPAWTLRGKPVLPQPIRVERISGPVLTVAAGDDKEWPSADETSLGGTPRANAAARADLWSRLLRYLARL
jgi:dienelactone hydrolase